MAGLNLGQNISDGASVEGQVGLMNPTSSVEAAFDLSWEQTPVGAIARIMSQREAEQAGGAKLMPTELNEMFPHIPEKFSEPTSMRVAQLVVDRHDERRRLQEAIDNGPKDFLNGTSTFAASLLPHVIDPLNVAAAFATGGLSSYFAGARALSVAARLGLSIGENVAANMALEPIVFAANRMDKTPYTVGDAFANSIAPAVAFPVIGYAGKRLLRAAGLMDPAIGGALHDASISRMAQGLDPKTGAQLLTKQLVRETTGTDFKPYAFKQLDPVTPNDRPFYGARVSTGENAVIGEFVGDALYVSDNANVANGSAARLGHSAPGKVMEYDLTGAKIVDLNGEVPDEVLALGRELLGTNIKNGNQLINALSTMVEDNKTFQDFQDGVKAMGYDGVAYKLEKYLDEDHPPHNVVAIFNKEKFQSKAELDANPEVVPRLSKEEIRSFAQKQIDEDMRDDAFIQDPDGIEEVLAYAEKETILTEKVTQIKTEAKELLDDVLEMEKGDYLEGDELKELEQLKKLAAKQEKIPLATAQALACIRGA